MLHELFSSAKAARLLRACLITQLRFTAALTDGRGWGGGGDSGTKASEHEQHGRARLKRQSDGRDVTQPQLTGITQRPSDGDARLFASYWTFGSAERARVRELMRWKTRLTQQGSVLPS